MLLAYTFTSCVIMSATEESISWSWMTSTPMSASVPHPISANETESDSLLREAAHAVPMPMAQATSTLGTVATCATAAATPAGNNVHARVAMLCAGLCAARVMTAPQPMAKHPSMGICAAITPPSAQMTRPATSDDPPRGAFAPDPAGTISPCSGESSLGPDAFQSASALVCSSVSFSVVMT